ncbi:hypothetical protein C5167_028294, partial [Papaver somniferum]
MMAGPVLIPGLCLPKALQPLIQGLISGSAELREQAAQGLGELIEVTSEKALKEFVVPLPGMPLIRIISDRFPWQVKSAILSTLSIIITKGGIALKPFLPQLQTTFIKCLQDSARTVRSSAALALGKLSAVSIRVDPLVRDFLSSLQLLALWVVVGENANSEVWRGRYGSLQGMLFDDGCILNLCRQRRILGVRKLTLEADEDRVGSINGNGNHTWRIFGELAGDLCRGSIGSAAWLKDELQR